MKNALLLTAAIALLAIGSAAQATMLTYSIVDRPAYQADTKVSGQTDHVSGTILADPTTGVISSASFTITGATSYTVASATFDLNPYHYFVNISPTQITVTSMPVTGNNPYGYGSLCLKGAPSGSPAFDLASLNWYVPHDPWIAGDNTIAAYTGSVYNNSGKARGADFSESVLLYPVQQPPTPYPTWVVATVVPEPSSLLALSAGLATIAALRRRATRA
jgi:hypothetical protein